MTTIKEKIFLIFIALAIIGVFVYKGIQSGSIHLYFSNHAEEKMIVEEDYTQYSSGDVSFNKNENGPSFDMQITFENTPDKLLAYADRKSFSFPNNYMIIQLLDEEKNYLNECRVDSKDMCDLGKNITLSSGDYTIMFTSSEKHTWELWVEVH